MKASFTDFNSLGAVLTQSVVQDVLWVHLVARNIRKIRSPAYFIPIPITAHPDDAKTFYVVVSLPRDTKTIYHDAWQRLADKGRPFKLGLFKSERDGEPTETWTCRLVDHSVKVSELGGHPIEHWEVVIHALRAWRRPNDMNVIDVKSFGNRSAANAAMKSGTDQ